MIAKAGRKEWGGAPVVKGFLPPWYCCLSGGSCAWFSHPLGEGLTYMGGAGSTPWQGVVRETELVGTGDV